MNNPDHRISRELAPEIFQLASELYAQKQQEYSLQELIIIGEEAKIPAEFIQQATELILLKQKNQEIQRHRKQNRFKLALLGVLATGGTLIIGGWTYNQLSASNSSPQSPVGILPGKNEKNYMGNVERYLLNKEGLVDGLLLSDGKQVKFPSHLSEQIVAAIKPKDSVEVIGKLGSPSVYGQEIEAHTVTNTQTKAIVAKQPKPKGRKKPEPTDVVTRNIEDSVQHWLVNDKAEIKGAILTSGTQVQFAKPLGKSLNKVAKIGSQIKADGVGKQTPHGDIVEVISLQIDGSVLPNANY
ncbi:MAG: hypothetical protein KME52_27495 [Desmonostoc geniculatum HA4340-LM1]|jgi:hypothetical protein|nr:hypothetical protein [Desmonostoc geniculatum HA4340-LM1]